MRSRPSVLCLALAIVVVHACRASSSGSVTFGAAGPWNENYGIMNRRGIELAVEELNARPDRRGPELRVLFRDDQADAMRAAAVAREFVDSADVVAVIGHLNSAPMASAARVYDGKLPAVSTTASSPDLSGISPWAFRVISSDSMNGLQIARFAMRTGRRRAAILYENNSYGRGLTDAFQRGFRGDIISVDPIAEGAEQSFEPFVSFYKERAPDIVFVAGTGASGLAFLREARRQGLSADLVGADGWSVLAADTALSEGVLVGAPFGADMAAPGARRFAEAFQKRYGVSPDGNAALAYDATRLLATAVERVGADRRRIRDYLRTLGTRGGFDGVTGSISFSADGDPIGKSMVMTRIRHGALVVENVR
jgi:branched-chain amino acid transport system substrate-binding protein